MSRVNDALTRATGERSSGASEESAAVAPDFGALLHAEEAAQLWPTERHAASEPAAVPDAPRVHAQEPEPVAADAAQSIDGSWWPAWTDWLAEHAGALVAAPRRAGSAEFPVIEPAPGRYVKERAE